MEAHVGAQGGGPIRRLTYHVEQDPSWGNWVVRQEGAPRPYSTHNAKSEAIEEGERLAENHRPSSLVTRNEDNSEDHRNTYD